MKKLFSTCLREERFDNLTPTQVEHYKKLMLKVLKAQEEGKKAVYRDERVSIDGTLGLEAYGT